jgi:RNA polymerase sigma-70 factor (ECF subfamily)
MSTGQRAGLLGHVREAYLKRELGDLSDALLLTRYLSGREEAVFEAILRRHGGMVFGVCRRILGDAHDAEDAFQATFLVFVRKAGAIVPRAGLGGWLHGVARRTAMKARTKRARWNAEGQLAMTRASETAGDDHAWSDLRPLLDQELAKLAAKYRLPIVLCDLEGKSRKEAAAQLDWREGTLSGRLARGRRLLAVRLTRRGVALSAAGLTALLLPHTTAAEPPAVLLTSTVTAATQFAAGNQAAVPAPVADLTREVLQAMRVQKLLTWSAVFLAVLLGTGAALGFTPLLGGDQPEPQTQRTRPAGKQDGPGAAVSGKIYLHRGIDFTAYDVRQKEFAELPQVDEANRTNYQADSARLAPDGRTLAFGLADGGRPPSEIYTRDVTKEDPPAVLVSMPGSELSSWNWSPDGKRLSFAVWEEGDKKYHPYLVDLATKKAQKLTLPELRPFETIRSFRGKGLVDQGVVIHAWSPDGLWLVHTKGHFFLVNPLTKDTRQVTAEPTGFFRGTCRFSPDGKKVAFIGVTAEKQYNLSVLDLLVGKPRVLAKLPGRWDFGVCWSPDSRRVAVSTIEVDANERPNGPSRVEAYEADGRGRPQTLLEQPMTLFTVTAWR